MMVCSRSEGLFQLVRTWKWMPNSRTRSGWYNFYCSWLETFTSQCCPQTKLNHCKESETKTCNNTIGTNLIFLKIIINVGVSLIPSWHQWVCCFKSPHVQGVGHDKTNWLSRYKKDKKRWKTPWKKNSIYKPWSKSWTPTINSWYIFELGEGSGCWSTKKVWGIHHLVILSFQNWHPWLLKVGMVVVDRGIKVEQLSYLDMSNIVKILGDTGNCGYLRATK